MMNISFIKKIIIIFWKILILINQLILIISKKFVLKINKILKDNNMKHMKKLLIK